MVRRDEAADGVAGSESWIEVGRVGNIGDVVLVTSGEEIGLREVEKWSADEDAAGGHGD